MTPAPTALLFTGSRCGPLSGRLGASSETPDSGATVCPTVATVMTPAAAATAPSSPRRVSPSDRPAPGAARPSASRITGSLTPTWVMMAPTASHAVQ